MRADIHPAYAQINVKCNCGHTFPTSSTLGKDLNIDVCNKCHPFYTGKQKIVNTARVDRFMQKFAGYSMENSQQG
ncbi:MAG: 50S ribosomal protein L31 [Gammaproteobacteria bacterium]